MRRIRRQRPEGVAAALGGDGLPSLGRGPWVVDLEIPKKRCEAGIGGGDGGGGGGLFHEKKKKSRVRFLKGSPPLRTAGGGLEFEIGRAHV